MTKFDSRHPLAAHPVASPTLLRGFHVLAADAGTGKTWTIARLVLRALIERELRIGQIAVLTFTKAAAGELKARIGQIIDSALSDDRPDDDPFFQAYDLDPGGDAQAWRARLRVARFELDDAPITTIHGFCHRLLGDHSLSLGRWDELDPAPDDGAALDAVVAAWWRANIASADDDAVWLLGPQGLSHRGLVAVLKPLLVNPMAALRPPPDDRWPSLAGRLRDCAERARRAFRDQAAGLQQWLDQTPQLNRNRYRIKAIPDWFRALTDWLDGLPESLDRPCAGLIHLDPRKLENSYKKGQAHGHEAFSFCALVAELNQLRIERSNLNTSVAHEIATAAASDMRQRERRQKHLSFDDLLLATMRALCDPELGDELAGALRNRYPLAFVDEFQDTDPVQWAIFQRIYQPGIRGDATAAAQSALILVGDPKQAIYSFRNADVHTYLAAVRAGAEQHRLDQNQRSGGGLINGVNAILDRSEPFLLAGFEFPGARHGHAADKPENRPPDDGLAALCLVDMDEPDGMDVAGLAARALQFTSDEISRLLSTGIAPAEIAILVRTGEQGARAKRRLAQAGIGAVEVSRDSVFVGPSAFELHRVLAAIADPRHAGYVRGAAATGLLGGFSDNGAGDESWQALTTGLMECSRHWFRAGPQAALRGLLLLEHSMALRLAALGDGERRMTDLLHLLDLLAANERARETPAQAQAWLGAQLAAARDHARGNEDTQLRLESDEDLVRILTIHNSKGLEFPIVFVPFSFADAATPLRDPVLVCPATDQLRVIFARSSLDLLTNTDIVQAAPWPAIARREEFAENLRLAYVGLTRARQRCYVFWGALAISRSKGPADKAQLAALAYWLDRDAVGLDASGEKIAASRERIDRSIRQMSEQGLLSRIRFDSSRSLKPVPSAETLPRSVTRETAGGETGVAAVSLSLAKAPPALALSWSRRSFTSLVDGGHAEPLRLPDHDEAANETLTIAAAAEADELLQEAVTPAPPVRDADNDIRWRFTRGANAGSCLHDMLETADFRDELRPEQLAVSLARFGLVADDAQAVANWLNQVLDAQIHEESSSWRLRDIARPDSLREMAFVLPAGGLVANDLTRTIGREYPLTTRLDESNWRGFLSGFIDVLVRRNGRYWVLDWKSNWLGDHAFDYGRESMLESIREHSYALQFCLYSLAVHRLLGQRLSDYRYDRHFGGVIYVYLRGAGAPSTASAESDVARHQTGDLQAAVDSRADSEAARLPITSNVAQLALSPKAVQLPLDFEAGTEKRSPEAGTDSAGIYVTRPSRELIDELDRLFKPMPALGRS